MIDIEAINQTIHILKRSNFRISIEDGTVFTLRFQTAQFYHLLGLHYLVDLPDMSNNGRSDEIIKRLLDGRITLSYLQKSAFFGKIAARLEHFSLLADMLVANRCKIIVDFDPSLITTQIKSRYLLYKTDSSHSIYYLFGIACTPRGVFYPETFFVEPSRYYVSEQNLLDCVIDVEEFQSKKRI